jgi:ribonuclease HI
MSIPTLLEKPRVLLFTQARRPRPQTAESDRRGGWWHFLLESLDGRLRLEAGDFEPNLRGERLELLAVVRGLEALDQPSHVTLVTPSRYVQRGLRYGLHPWRENHWRWERFGELTPVKNADLWQRVDRAMEFHRLECRVWRLDAAPHSQPTSVGSDNVGSDNVGSAVPRPHFRRPRRRATSQADQQLSAEYAAVGS